MVLKIFQAGVKIQLDIIQSGLETVFQKHDFGLGVIFYEGWTYLSHLTHKFWKSSFDEQIQLFLEFFKLFVIFSSILNLVQKLFWIFLSIFYDFCYLKRSSHCISGI